MTSLTECMRDHHEVCDKLFAQAEAACLARQWDACQTSTQGFVAAMGAHFGAEEEHLFPLCEAANPVAKGPAAVMRGEHAMMRELLADLLRAAQDRDEEGFRSAGDTLVILMRQHNLKEEHILYPLCERSIPAAAALAVRLRGALEDSTHV